MTAHGRRQMEPAVYGLALERIGVPRNGRRNGSFEAARLVLVEGRRVCDAVRICSVRRASVYQAIAKLEAAFADIGLCVRCGQRLP